MTAAHHKRLPLDAKIIHRSLDGATISVRGWSDEGRPPIYLGDSVDLSTLDGTPWSVGRVRGVVSKGRSIDTPPTLVILETLQG